MLSVYNIVNSQNILPQYVTPEAIDLDVKFSFLNDHLLLY